MFDDANKNYTVLFQFEQRKLYVSTQPLCHEQDVTLDQIFKRSTAGLNSAFSFSENSCFTKDKITNLGAPIYPELGEKKAKSNGFMPFPRAFEWSEMQIAASSWIWTWVINSTSYDDDDGHKFTQSQIISMNLVNKIVCINKKIFYA